MSRKKNTLQQIDDPHYRYWQALYLSFYESRLYVDVVKRWTGLGLIYLLLLVSIATAPFAIRLAVDFKRFFVEKLLLPIQKMPLLIIQNGRVLFDRPMPYLIKNTKGVVVGAVDTTGVITPQNQKYPELSVLITGTQLIYWAPSLSLFFVKDDEQPKTAPSVQTFSPNMTEVFDSSRWLETSGIRKIQYLSLAIIYPLLVAMLFATFAVFLVTFALMAQLIASMFFKAQLRFAQSCRLLAVASTAPIIIFMLALVTNWAFLGIGVVLIAILAGYFCFGVMAVRRESNKMVRG